MNNRKQKPDGGKDESSNTVGTSVSVLTEKSSIQDLDRANSLAHSLYQANPKDPLTIGAMAAHLVSMDQTGKRTGQIPTLIENLRKTHPLMSNFLKGHALIYGRGYPKDEQAEARLFLLNIEHDVEPVFVMPNFFLRLRNIFKYGDKKTVLNAFDLLCQRTEQPQETVINDPHYPIACFVRGTIDPNHSQRLEYISRAVGLGVPGAQNIMDAMLRQGPSAAPAPANQESVTSLSAPDPEADELVASLSGDIKWKDALQELSRFVKKRGVREITGDGSRLGLCLGNMNLKLHRQHGREGGNPHLEEGEKKPWWILSKRPQQPLRYKGKGTLTKCL